MAGAQKYFDALFTSAKRLRKKQARAYHFWRAPAEIRWYATAPTCKLARLPTRPAKSCQRRASDAFSLSNWFYWRGKV